MKKWSEKTINEINDKLMRKLEKLVTSDEYGYDSLKEFYDMCPYVLEIKPEGNGLVIEFRAEVGYDELFEIGKAFDEVIYAYDKYAYFEPVEPGITKAVLFDDLEEDLEEDEDIRKTIRELINRGTVGKDEFIDAIIDYTSEDTLRHFMDNAL